VLVALIELFHGLHLESLVQSEEEKRREHLDSLTADSDVRAPGIGHRIKEEVQAIAHGIYDKLCIPKKDRKTKT
jgi:hypothetical protein